MDHGGILQFTLLERLTGAWLPSVRGVSHRTHGVHQPEGMGPTGRAVGTRSKRSNKRVGAPRERCSAGSISSSPHQRTGRAARLSLLGHCLLDSDSKSVLPAKPANGHYLKPAGPARKCGSRIARSQAGARGSTSLPRLRPHRAGAGHHRRPSWGRSLPETKLSHHRLMR
jgi:hypothetical protein